MKKRMISAAAILLAAFSTCTVALADNTAAITATRDILRSKGAIVYRNGGESVVIDSDDLYELADRIDYFKTALSEQLGEVNTYFTKEEGRGTALNSSNDIKVVHTQPVPDHAVDPVTVDFDVLFEGLAASQSVPDDVTDYGYVQGTNLYKTSEGELTTDTEKAAEQIDIHAATAANLSAGTAAWVNGELLLGTGADNKSYADSQDDIINLINLVYSGITKDEEYEVYDYIGNGFSTSASRSSGSKGTTYGKKIGGRSVKFPVWVLESDSDNKLLNRITIQRSGSNSASNYCSKGSNTKYRVFTEDGTIIFDGSTDTAGNIPIDVMTLPISTQYIYIECESKPSATIHSGAGSTAYAQSSVSMKDTLKATYLINP